MVGSCWNFSGLETIHI